MTKSYQIQNPQEETLLAQGAEAKIYLIKNSMPQPNQKNKQGYTILKSRIPKTYRHPTLDKKIRTRRTKSETKILTKALQAKINVPNLIHSNSKFQIPNPDKFQIYMEFIEGDRLSQTLNSYPIKKQLSIMQKLGRQIAKLHKHNIIHSDLTTSNTILSSSKIFLIDFGLSYISTKIEDKAVDLHLLNQALQAKHYQNAKRLFIAFRQGYKHQDSKKILERLNIVEQRGRYKKSSQ